MSDSGSAEAKKKTWRASRFAHRSPGFLCAEGKGPRRIKTAPALQEGKGSRRPPQLQRSGIEAGRIETKRMVVETEGGRGVRARHFGEGGRSDPRSW